MEFVRYLQQTWKCLSRQQHHKEWQLYCITELTNYFTNHVHGAQALRSLLDREWSRNYKPLEKPLDYYHVLNSLPEQFESSLHAPTLTYSSKTSSILP